MIDIPRFGADGLPMIARPYVHGWQPILTAQKPARTEFSAGTRIMDIAIGAGIAESGKRAKEIIRGGGFKAGGKKITDPTAVIPPGRHMIESGKNRIEIKVI